MTACFEAKIIIILVFMFLRPSPEKIFECFLEVAAPADGEGTFHFIL